MIKTEILAKLSDEALLQLVAAAQKEYDSRMDYSLMLNAPCYAIVKGKREDFILKKYRRTKAEVTCMTSGTNYLIPINMLKTDGRRREKPVTQKEVASRSGKPTTAVPTATW